MSEIRFTLRGKNYALNRADVEQEIKHTQPKRIQKYFVTIEGKHYPPKQIIETVLQVPAADFTTIDAARVLKKLGLQVRTNSKEATVGEGRGDNRESLGFDWDYPEALQSIYRTAEVNKPLSLHEGDLQLTQNGRAFAGPGKVELTWFPSPRIRFEITPALNSPRAVKGPEVSVDAEIRLQSRAVCCPCVVLGAPLVFLPASQAGSHSSPRITGSLRPTQLGVGDSITRVLFHVVNFCEFDGGQPVRDARCVRQSRAVMHSQGWNLTLDWLHDNTFARELRRVSGYAITHVGLLERSDGGTFSAGKAQQMLLNVSRLLSFSCGTWVASILPVGFDESGQQVWEEWQGDWHIDRFRRVPSWFDYRDPDCLNEVLPGFLRAVQDQTLSPPMKLALNVYLDSNGFSGNRESSIVLTQIAFEALARALKIHKTRSKSDGPSKKDRDGGGEKLRALLDYCKIPSAIPTCLKKLSATAPTNGWADGPHAVTQLRNWAAHPIPENLRQLFNVDVITRYEASQLSLWYLELIILKLCGYDGQYANRLFYQGWRGDEIERVPWANKATV